MKRYQVSGLLGNKRIKIYILSNSPENAIKIFKQKFKNAEDLENAYLELQKKGFQREKD